MLLKGEVPGVVSPAGEGGGVTSWFLFSFPSCELIALWFPRTFEYMVSGRSWKDRFLLLQDFFILFLEGGLCLVLDH